MDRTATHQYIIDHLKKVFVDREARQIAKIYLEDKWSGIDDFTHLKDHIIMDIQSLLKGKPIQYVTGKAYFYDRLFEVNENTLIPRPETEELVYIIIKDQQHFSGLRILDIGTGSGCIPITLSAHLKKSEIVSIDINQEAIEIATINNNTYKTNVNFIHIDFLDKDVWERLGEFDIIVSNPPYISKEEKKMMGKSVLQYEPYHALFPGGEDPLIFYRQISEFALQHLKCKGMIYLEINEFLSHETQTIFQSFSKSELIKDMQKKDRMLKVWK